MKRFPKAVIFDMDGLLVDSEPVWAICEADVLAARGKQWDAAIQNQFIGMRINDFAAGMCREYGLGDPAALAPTIRDEIIARMVDIIPTHVVPRPGANELLAALEGWGVPCAIASSSPMNVIDATVRSQGWDEYFVTHVCGDDVDNGKPAPDIYLEAARQLGVPPAGCLALEDSPNGTRAAVAAGMTCYAIPDLSHSTHAAFARITPYVFDSLHEVVQQLKGLRNSNE